MAVSSVMKAYLLSQPPHQQLQSFFSRLTAMTDYKQYIRPIQPIMDLVVDQLSVLYELEHANNSIGSLLNVTQTLFIEKMFTDDPEQRFVAFLDSLQAQLLTLQGCSDSQQFKHIHRALSLSHRTQI